MNVKSLEFKNYRNLVDGKIFPSEKINIIYGNNAQGKTNIVEALWLFCGGHSFKGSKENEFIKFGEKFSKIKATTTNQKANPNPMNNIIDNIIIKKLKQN